MSGALSKAKPRQVADPSVTVGDLMEPLESFLEDHWGEKRDETFAATTKYIVEDLNTDYLAGRIGNPF